jgi:hypothetical protein
MFVVQEGKVDRNCLAVTWVSEEDDLVRGLLVVMALVEQMELE